jgi:DNA-binding FadR family transcriptional regulator
MSPARAHEVHQRLVEAILAGDRDQIHRTVVAHTIDSAQVLADLLQADTSATG